MEIKNNHFKKIRVNLYKSVSSVFQNRIKWHTDNVDCTDNHGFFKIYSKHNFYVLLLALSTSCSRIVTTPDGGMGLPIKLANPSYPIPVFYASQEIGESYSAIGPVKVEREVELTKTQMKTKRLLNRGNDEEQKRALLDQLIIQGVSMGANALINVRYQYYTTATYQGYVMEGTAVKYEIKE